MDNPPQAQTTDATPPVSQSHPMDLRFRPYDLKDRPPRPTEFGPPRTRRSASQPSTSSGVADVPPTRTSRRRKRSQGAAVRGVQSNTTRIVDAGTAPPVSQITGAPTIQLPLIPSVPIQPPPIPSVPVPLNPPVHAVATTPSSRNPTSNAVTSVSSDSMNTEADASTPLPNQQAPQTLVGSTSPTLPTPDPIMNARPTPTPLITSSSMNIEKNDQQVAHVSPDSETTSSSPRSGSITPRGLSPRLTKGQPLSPTNEIQSTHINAMETDSPNFHNPTPTSLTTEKGKAPENAELNASQGPPLFIPPPDPSYVQYPRLMNGGWFVPAGDNPYLHLLGSGAHVQWAHPSRQYQPPSTAGPSQPVPVASSSQHGASSSQRGASSSQHGASSSQRLQRPPLSRTSTASSVSTVPPKVSRASSFSRTPSSINTRDYQQGHGVDVDMDAPPEAPNNSRELTHHVLMSILAGINEMKREAQALQQEFQTLRHDLAQMIATEVQAYFEQPHAQPPPANIRRGREGTAGPRAEAQLKKKKGVDKEAWKRPANCPKENWDLLKSAARDHLRKLLGIENTTVNELRKLPLPFTDEELKDLEYDAEGNCWTFRHFRLDFSQPWSSPPNASAKRVFIRSFIYAVQGGTYIVPEELLREKLVEGRFYGYFNHLKPLVNGVQNSAPTNEALTLRRAQNSRRKTLYKRRLEAGLSRRALAEHIDLLEGLRPIHMSDDEAENPGPDNRTFRIISVKWRSEAFTAFLRNLDHIYFENWRRPFSNRIREEYRSTTMKTPGNIPRTRNPSDLSVEGVPPLGLPLNCYNLEWYNSLPEWARDGLDAITDPNQQYDFTIPARELRSR